MLRLRALHASPRLICPLALVWLAIAACGSTAPASVIPPPTRSPDPSVAPSALAARDIAEARRFRMDFGLRSDESWIREVAADPTSADGKMQFGVPLTPSEVQELERRATGIEAIRELVIAYGLAHPDEYAGAWIDQPGGGILVTQFSGHVEEHRAALRSRVSPNAPLEVRQVQRSLAYLKAEAARIDPNDPWFRSIPAVVISAGVDDVANQVFIRISSINADATRLIEDHFGWHGAVLVESDGTGALLLPRGSLVITVRDARGNPVPGLRCVAIPDLAGAYEAPVDAPRTNEEGVCRIDLPATGYWIRIERTQDPRSHVAIERSVVVEGRTSALAITVPAP